jgi:GH15 family glucan-1,4-alpha-glucosidase
LIRLVHGLRGKVRMRMELIVRFGYGKVVPWVRRQDFGISAIAGPDALELRTPVELRGEDFTTVAEFSVGEGATVPFLLDYHPSYRPAARPPDCHRSLEDTARFWSEWSGRCHYGDHEAPHWRDAVVRSLITLKCLSFAPTGGIVAALTTSLPEQLGGVRNWDYRFCWIRDATLMLYALLTSGYRDEALAWREWLVRAAAGRPAELQTIYGVAGERRLTELELPWLPGYQGSSPVRIGNLAFKQLQLDVYGELLDALHVGRKFELKGHDEAWRVQKALLAHLARIWTEPDEGIWEVRGPRRHFTHSKLMAWVAFDRAIKAVESFGLAGPLDEWRRLRAQIHEDICKKGLDPERNCFVQYYGGEGVDAALLLIPQVGFLPPEDPRVQATVAAIERELMEDGLVLRYRTEEHLDGLPPGEGTFLACSFWLADVYGMLGRHADAERLFEHLLSLRNDLGLLAEEYDPRSGRQLGNFPQGFSHIALVNTANNLISRRGPAEQRAERDDGGGPD